MFFTIFQNSYRGENRIIAVTNTSFEWILTNITYDFYNYIKTFKLVIENVCWTRIWLEVVYSDVYCYRCLYCMLVISKKNRTYSLNGTIVLPVRINRHSKLDKKKFVYYRWNMWPLLCNNEFSVGETSRFFRRLS